MTNTLKQYEEIKSPLLKEWDGELFERITKHIYYMLEANLRHNVVIEHGHNEKHLIYNYKEQMGDIFGLPYTSGGDFAAVWNTNTQTVAKHGKRLYFRGVAVAEDKQTVLIFHDEKENYFYFYDYDFIRYQEEEQRRERARYWGEFCKASNTIKNKCIEILGRYTGKAYGEKTKQKIYDELREAAELAGGCRAWLDAGQYGQGLEVTGKNNTKQKYYFEFLDTSNKITTPADRFGQSVADVAELDTLKEYEKAGALVDKMKKKARELLQIVEEFKKHSYAANYTPKETQNIFKLDVENLAKGRITWEG